MLKTKQSTLKDDGFKKAFLESLNDDLNISKALSVLDDFITSANEQLDAKAYDKIPQMQENLAFITRVLGIGVKDSFAYFKLGVSEELRQEIEAKIAKRAEFKAKKDFQNADKIREELREIGIEIMDTAQGCEWEKI